MDSQLVFRLFQEKCCDRSTYVLALIVGTLVNGYGQLLLPWIRSDINPFDVFTAEFDARPGLAIFSVFLGYAFPFCVSTYSAVVTRYNTRRLESIADFPDKKPDPVFRAATDGQLVEVGATTQSLFEKHHIDSAQKIFGDALWQQIVEDHDGRLKIRFFFEAENMEYVVTNARTANNNINVYLSPIPP